MQIFIKFAIKGFKDMFRYLMYFNMEDSANEKILKLEDILKDKTLESNQNVKNNKKKKRDNVSKIIPKGKRKSGRFWKNEREKPSNIIKTRGIKNANKFNKLKNLKKELGRIKLLSKNIVDERKEEIEKKKERRRQNIKRSEENRLKSEIVQEVKNPAKIKRMKYKQLRTIEKRDTLKMN